MTALSAPRLVLVLSHFFQRRRDRDPIGGKVVGPPAVIVQGWWYAMRVRTRKQHALAKVQLAQTGTNIRITNASDGLASSII